MNQEQLSLETCKEIGHLFHKSRYGWIVYEEPKDPAFPKQEPELYDYWEPRKPWCEFYTRLASHPSITDMIKWLWGKHYAILPLGRSAWALYHWVENYEEWELADSKTIEAQSPIEAYAEAVKIVLKEMEK